VSERDALDAFDAAALDPGGLDPDALGSGMLAPAPRRETGEHSRGRARLIAGALLVTVAITGVIGGAALDQWMILNGYTRPGRLFGVDIGSGLGRRGSPRTLEEERERQTEFLSRELSLTPPQRARIDSIVAVQVAQVHALWTEVGPRMDDVIGRARTEIDRVLTPEQRVKFQALRERFDRGRRGFRPPR
jgi:hypothetical protein